MKKNLLFERFQKLAGIKPLNESAISLDEKEFEEFEEQYEKDGKILRNFYKDGSGDKDKIRKAHEKLHMHLNDGIPDFDYDKDEEGLYSISMAQRELEPSLRQLFSKGNEYELDEETTPIIGNNSHNTTSTPLIEALYSVNTYELESNIKDYLLEVYKEEGFGKATDKMVAIERALDQARDSFNKADFSS